MRTRTTPSTEPPRNSENHTPPSSRRSGRHRRESLWSHAQVCRATDQSFAGSGPQEGKSDVSSMSDYNTGGPDGFSSCCSHPRRDLISGNSWICWLNCARKKISDTQNEKRERETGNWSLLSTTVKDILYVTGNRRSLGVVSPSAVQQRRFSKRQPFNAKSCVLLCQKT